MKKVYFKRAIPMLLSACFLLTACAKSDRFTEVKSTSAASEEYTLANGQLSSPQTISVEANAFAAQSLTDLLSHTKSSTVKTSAKKDKANIFVHTDGSKLVYKNDKDFILKGISLGNDVWGNPASAPKTHHNEHTYKELSEMGFNSVRFYLNYALFESDDNPYHYKETAFEWLDTNIEWARKYGIKIVLNMHYPQGGYQSNGNGLALWTDKENKKRLIALWKAIAKRYADEPVIVGYGLINEPILPELGTYEKTIGQWSDMMQDITDEIRTVDKNHIVFIERPISVRDIGKGKVDWSKYNFRTMSSVIDDDNAVYEFHYYEPFQFTHQNAEWAGRGGEFMGYNTGERVIENVDNGWVTFTGASFKSSEGDWSRFETDFVSAKSNYNLGAAVMQGSTLKNGTAYYDDIVITEYNNNGAATGKTVTYDFNSKSQGDKFSFWSADGKGSSGYSYTEGCGGTGCVYISGTSDDAVLSGERFILNDGCKYKISGKVRKIGNDGFTMIRCDFAHADKISTVNSDYLEAKLMEIVDFGKENNVPIYIGEFGTISDSFKENRNGDEWVADMLRLMKKYGFGFSYHDYHETGFGLYQDYADVEPHNINEALEAVFRKLLPEI